MKKILFNAVLSMALALAFAGASSAEVKVDDIKSALGMSVYLQAGYTLNFKSPDSGENELRVFDHKADGFTLDLAQLLFTKDAPSGGIGYKVKLSAGETAKFIHSNGLGSGDDSFDLTEAYIDYLAPVGKGFKMRLGKFATYIGAEVIEAKDNPNYSRSLLFNYAIPFTHTGLMLGYGFSDVVSASLYVVNGWDNTDDNNKGKSVGLSIGLAPAEQFSGYISVMYGPEQTDDNSDMRTLLDVVATIKPVTNLTFILNGDYATEETSGSDNAKWYGIAGIAKYDFSETVSGSIRAEYFNDRDGVRTGIVQKLKELTITPEFKVAKAIIVRPEYRHDWSDEKAFDSGDRKSQDTLSVGVMYTW